MNANRRPMTGLEYRAAQARAMTERQLLDAVLGTPRKPGLALAYGWRGYHTHRSQHSPAGFPDLTLVRAGRLIFAELKTERGKTTDEQDAWLEDLGEVADRGQLLGASVANPLVAVYLWRPSDLLDGTIERILRTDTPTTPGLALPPRT